MLITIKYAGSKKKLQIKADSKKKTKEWILELGKALKNLENLSKLTIEKEFLELYWREDVMSEADFAKYAETGDVLLFKYLKELELKVVFIFLKNSNATCEITTICDWKQI